MRFRLVLVLVLMLTSLQSQLIPVAASQPHDDPPPVVPGDIDPAPDAAARQRGNRHAQRNGQRKRTGASDRNRRSTPANERRGRNAEPQPVAARRLKSGIVRGGEQRALRAQRPGTRYIVVLKEGRLRGQNVSAELRDAPGVIPTHVYRHVFDGFAAYLTPDAKRALEQDSRVASITQDQKDHLAVQTYPAGIRRIGGLANPVAQIDGADQRVDVDIAIIDSGVDLTHPDLNVFAYVDCTPTPASEDRFDLNGHGTHVAGTAAALDNNDGVVGVAPGARIWAMRVMDNNGDIFRSYIIDCLDVVTRHARTPFEGQTVDVANVSIAGGGSDSRCAADAYHAAYCRAVAAGVTVVVAAANEAQNASRFVPAAYDEVITVSALADADGNSGGVVGTYDAICHVSQRDDGLASFSNFGADVDLAAPGVDVMSTYPTYLTPTCTWNLGAGYTAMAGTSMASPHVAGAAGLIKARNRGFTPKQVKAALLSSRERVALHGDPDGLDEGILNVSPDGGATSAPAVTIQAPRSAKVKKTIRISVIASDPSGIEQVILFQCAPQCRPIGSDNSAPYAFTRKHSKPGKVTYAARAYDNERNFTDKFTTITIKKSKKRR